MVSQLRLRSGAPEGVIRLLILENFTAIFLFLSSLETTCDKPSIVNLLLISRVYILEYETWGIGSTAYLCNASRLSSTSTMVPSSFNVFWSWACLLPGTLCAKLCFVHALTSLLANRQLFEETVGISDSAHSRETSETTPAGMTNTPLKVSDG